jgi:formylglycine-generating enzyme required for sulfatase activity
VNSLRRQEVVLIIALSVALLAIAVGATWYRVTQESARVAREVSTSVQAPKVSVRPAPVEAPAPARAPEPVAAAAPAPAQEPVPDPQPKTFTTVDQALESLPLARVAFNAPDQARISESFVIEAKISTHLRKEEMILLIEEPGKKEAATLKVSDRMAATLMGGASFDVTPSGPQEQWLSDRELTTWTWEVTPKIAGYDQILILNFDAIVSINNKDDRRSVNTFKKHIHVDVSWPETVGEWLDLIKKTGENASWIWASIFIPITGGVWAWLKHRRQALATAPLLSDPAAIGNARHSRRVALIVVLSAASLATAVGALLYFVMKRDIRADTTSSVILVHVPEPDRTRGSIRTGTRSIREPEMTVIPGGSFAMGSNDDPSEEPIHEVSIESVAFSKFPITVREWNECVAARQCADLASGGPDTPVTNVSWVDAQQFVTWLAQVTHKNYRLPSEAEWEYAARGGTHTEFWWGDQFRSGMASCRDCGEGPVEVQPMKVGSFRPNQFGLYDMGGTVAQWVEDCWHKNYQGAPVDGSPWMGHDCTTHVVRSGSWRDHTSYVRPANRDHYDTSVRYPTHGFRIALSP